MPEQITRPPLERLQFSHIDVASEVRPNKPQGNEDAVAISTDGVRTHVGVVIDGMGGRLEASSAAIAAAQYIGVGIDSLVNMHSPEEIQQAQENVFFDTHRFLQARYPGTGVTAVALSLWNTAFSRVGIITWSGDARAYLLTRTGKIKRLTLDMGTEIDFDPHMSQSEKDANVKAILDEADTIEWENQIALPILQQYFQNRSIKAAPYHLGQYFPELPPDTYFGVRSMQVNLNKGDRILLVSDGISDNLTTNDILSQSQSAKQLVTFAQAVSQQNRFRSTLDDTTAMILTV